MILTAHTPRPSMRWPFSRLDFVKCLTFSQVSSSSIIIIIVVVVVSVEECLPLGRGCASECAIFELF